MIKLFYLGEKGPPGYNGTVLDMNLIDLCANLLISVQKQVHRDQLDFPEKEVRYF